MQELGTDATHSRNYETTPSGQATEEAIDFSELRRPEGPTIPDLDVVLPKINAGLTKLTGTQQDIKLGQQYTVDIVDSENVLRRGAATLITTYTEQEGDGGGAYLYVHGSNELIHLSGTGANNSYIRPHTVNLASGAIGAMRSNSPRVHFRSMSQLIDILDLTDTDGDGVYQRRCFNGDYLVDRRMDGTVDVKFFGREKNGFGTHEGVRNRDGSLAARFPPQTMIAGSWDLQANSRQSLAIEADRQRNITVAKGFLDKHSSRRSEDGMTHIAGAHADSRLSGGTSGSGMYYADAAITRHMYSPSDRPGWHENGEIQNPELAELQIPDGNQPEQVRLRRAVAVPTFKETQYGDKTLIDYAFLRNYGGKPGALILTDNSELHETESPLMTDLVRETYRAARDVQHGTLITHVYHEVTVGDEKYKARVRADGSVEAALTSDTSELIGPVLDDERAAEYGSTLAHWDKHQMQFNEQIGLFVETSESIERKRAERLAFQEKRSQSTEDIDEWLSLNDNALERKGLALLKAGEVAGMYSAPEVQVADNIDLRGETSPITRVASSDGRAILFARRFRDRDSGQTQRGVLFIPEGQLLAHTTERKVVPIVAAAFAAIEQGIQIGEHRSIDVDGYKGVFAFRSDGSIEFASYKGAPEGEIIRPLLADGKLVWDYVPVVLGQKPDDARPRYYRARDLKPGERYQDS